MLGKRRRQPLEKNSSPPVSTPREAVQPRRSGWPQWASIAAKGGARWRFHLLPGGSGSTGGYWSWTFRIFWTNLSLNKPNFEAVRFRIPGLWFDRFNVVRGWFNRFMNRVSKICLFSPKTSPKLCFINTTRRIDQNNAIPSIPAIHCVYMSLSIVSPPTSTEYWSI